MKTIKWSLITMFIAVPLYGQGLTVTMKETGPAGQTTPILQADRTQARLDVPSLASQVLYDSATKTLKLLVPLAKIYREYTPASVQQIAAAAAASGRGQPAPGTNNLSSHRLQQGAGLVMHDIRRVSRFREGYRSVCGGGKLDRPDICGFYSRSAGHRPGKRSRGTRHPGPHSSLRHC